MNLFRRFERFYRSVSCMTDERQYADAIDQGVNVRAKRNPVNLPDSYDDYLNTKIKMKKSWKLRKYRKQWQKNLDNADWM